MKLLRNFTLKSNNTIVVPSKHLMEFVKNQGFKGNLLQINNGTELTESEQTNRDSYEFLIVSRLVRHKNIDNLFSYNPGKFLICRDFNRSIRHDWNRMNSSVFRLVSGSLPFVYDVFMENAAMNMRRFHGDQDWIYEMMSDKKSLWMFWPDEWIRSYKWEMRDRAHLDRIGGIRNFKVKADPIVHDLCNVAVFHGEPHPHQVEDDLV